MNMSKFSFVILHYNTIEDTKVCVSSIEDTCKNFEYHIYIVDNASPNKSGGELAKNFSQKDKITVIQSEENLGFAKGNNLGIHQSMKDGFDDFVVVLNSDTKVLQNDFCEKIEEEYVKSDFSVLGPTIFTPSGKTNINPGRMYIRQGADLDGLVKRCKKRLFLLKTHLFFLAEAITKLCQSNKKTYVEKQPKYTQNCLLHGCCLIFSKKYLNEMHGFDPRTFLYYEEEILYLHCMKRGLKTVYSPEIEIWHKEDGATDSILKSSRRKRIFICENVLRSIKVYKEILAEYERGCSC